MDMKRLFILAALLSAAALVSCQSIVEQDAPTAGDEIKFSASVGNYRTKVADDAFEEGDAVALTALSPINVNDVKLTWTGDAFLPEQPIYWGRQQTEETLFAAVYPFNTDINAEQGSLFTVGGDQSDIESYKAADLLIATTSGAPGKTVNLPFKHVLSRVDIRLRSELPVDGIIVDDVLCDAYIYPLRGSAFTTDESRTSVYIPYEIGNGGYSLIVPPQTSSPKIVIYSEDKEIVFAAPQPITLESGKIMRASVTISADQEVTFSSEIIPWEEGESFDIRTGEKPEEQDVQPFFIYEGASQVTVQMENLEGPIYKGRITKSEGRAYAAILIVNTDDFESDDLRVYGGHFNQFGILEDWNETGGDAEYYLFFKPKYGTGTFDIYFDASTRMVYATEFESLGTGMMVDNISTDLVGLPTGERSVEVEGTIDGNGIYIFRNPYLYSDYGQYASLSSGTIIIDASDPDRVYMDYCTPGLYYNGYEILYESYTTDFEWEVEEGSNYGWLYDGEIFFPARTLAYYCGGWYYGNYYGPSTFLLPGASRHYAIVGDLYASSFEGAYTLDDGTKVARISTALMMDNTLLRVGVFNGHFPTDDEISAALEAAQGGSDSFSEFTSFPYGQLFYVDMDLPETGDYWVMLYTEGTDGSSYYRYFNIWYTADGEETPAPSISISEPRASEISPESEATVTVTGNINYAFYAPIPESRAVEMSEEEIAEYLKTCPWVSPGEQVFSNGVDIVFSGMEPDTQYRLYVYGHSNYGTFGLDYVTFTTGSATQWTSLGYGTYYDDAIPAWWAAWDTTPFTWEEKGYLSEVEILQDASGLPKYRVMRPYDRLWAIADDALLGYKGLDPIEYFDFYCVEDYGQTYIFFSDYSTGFRYPKTEYWTTDTDCTLIYNHASYGVASPASTPTASYCREIQEGVFQIAPRMLISGTSRYVDNSTADGVVIITLPGYEYDLEASGAPAKAMRSMRADSFHPGATEAGLSLDQKASGPATGVTISIRPGDGSKASGHKLGK